MLRTLFIFAAACAALAQVPGQRQAPAAVAAKPGSIQGVVTGAADEPLRKAEVTLRSATGPSGFAGQGPMPVPMMGMAGRQGGGIWTVTTDASGSFRFDNVPPGSYVVSVQRNGYVRTEYGSRPGSRGGSRLVLGEAQELTGLSVKMTPHGVVAGRVLDEDGDPMAYVAVQVLRERWIGNRRQMMPLNGTSTNDLGEYRIAGLMPGRYYLMANFNRPEVANRVRAEGAGSDMTYTSLYFPGVTEAGQATTIQVVPGQELRGMDFQMRKAPTFRIRGSVLDETGKPAASTGVMAMPSEGAFMGMRGMGAGRGADGSFEIGGLTPGSYTLVATRMGRGEARTVARLSVQLGNRDLEGVVLQMQRTFEISGAVLAPEGVNPGGGRVVVESLEPGIPFGGNSGGRVEENGEWKVTGLSPGRYRISLAPVPQGAYLKSVSVQGQDISSGAEIGAAAAGIEIHLGANAPEVTGAVLGMDKEPVEGATVVLVPESGRREQYWLFRTAQTDRNGSFSLRGIAPGQYTAYAFREVEDGSWHSPDFLKPFEGKGVALKLAEGSAETVQVTAAQ